MRRLALTALLTATMTACAAPPASVPAPVNLQATYQRLTAAVGDAACQADSDCHTVGVGSKACGGPISYLAYSTRGGNEKTILAAAQALKDAQAADNRASGRVSDCMAVMDPGAQCVAGHCQLRSGRGSVVAPAAQ